MTVEIEFFESSPFDQDYEGDGVTDFWFVGGNAQQKALYSSHRFAPYNSKGETFIRHTLSEEQQKQCDQQEGKKELRTAASAPALRVIPVKKAMPRAIHAYKQHSEQPPPLPPEPQEDLYFTDSNITPFDPNRETLTWGTAFDEPPTQPQKQIAITSRTVRRSIGPRVTPTFRKNNRQGNRERPPLRTGELYAEYMRLKRTGKTSKGKTNIEFDMS